MKNCRPFFVILLISLLFFSISCSDDDDLTTPLEGTVWVNKSETISGCDNPSMNGTDLSQCTATNCHTLFLANGILTTTDINNGVTTTESGTYTISGNIITTNNSGSILEITYTIVSTTLTLVFNFDIGCTVTIILEKQ